MQKLEYADMTAPEGTLAQPPAAASLRRTSADDHGRQPHSRGRAVFSAIDLGTNNCRLLIARPVRDGFRVLDAFSRIVRLGEGMGESGRLSTPAMERAIDALRICARKIRRRRVTCMRAVATEACRSAANCGEFLDRVKAETGLNLDVISPGEEARLAVIGCQSLLDDDASHAVVFDIGGGSTELIFVERTGRRRLQIVAWTSLPYGVVSLAERFGTRSIPAAAYREMVALVKERLAAFEGSDALNAALAKGGVQLIGTSGTVTTLASVELGLRRYDRNRVDGAWFEAAAMHRLTRRVASMSYEARLAEPCIGGDRADYVVAGCAILDAMLEFWPFTRLRVADRGIREGILRGLMDNAIIMGP